MKLDTLTVIALSAMGLLVAVTVGFKLWGIWKKWRDE